MILQTIEENNNIKIPRRKLKTIAPRKRFIESIKCGEPALINAIAKLLNCAFKIKVKR